MTELAKHEQRISLDPDSESMRRVGYAMIDQWVEHVESLSDQRVAQRGSREDFASRVDEPLPIEPTDVDACCAFYFENVVPMMTRVNHPRFHAYIPCPSSYTGALGMMLAAGTNPFVGSWLGGATVAALELTVLRWIKELLALDSDCAGILTSGGSMANLIGLAAARQKFGRETLDQGVIYVSSEGHASVDKAARVLGFRKENVCTIECNPDFRINTEALKARIELDRREGRMPFVVSANAGTTNTGAIDDLKEIAAVCNEQDVWFHVDAAYGGFAAMVPEIREQMVGLEAADSLTLDPHKWLYCPMGVGCAFVRNAEFLEGAFSSHGNYLKDLSRDEVNFLDRGPELSRPARVLPVWMVLKSAGQEQLVYQIREDLRLAAMAAALLEEDGRFEIVSQQLSIVTFRHRIAPTETEEERSARDDALMEATLADGQLMLSSTILHGRNALRMVVMNHRTTGADIKRSVKRIRELAQ